jgi:hypothetical protein
MGGRTYESSRAITYGRSIEGLVFSEKGSRLQNRGRISLNWSRPMGATIPLHWEETTMFQLSVVGLAL